MRTSLAPLASGLCLSAAALAAQTPSLATGAVPASALPAATAAEPDLATLRTLTARFRDVNVALQEGYLRDPTNMCDAAADMGRPPEYGVMGIHFVRPDLLGITGPPSPRVSGTGTHTDFRQPAVLIYEPQQDGSLQLVAVENLVFIKAWEAAGHTAPPTYLGKSFDRMEDDPATPVDEAHLFEPHYDLHVWVHRDNPRGVFAQFNPNATCRFHQNRHAHTH